MLVGGGQCWHCDVTRQNVMKVMRSSFVTFCSIKTSNVNTGGGNDSTLPPPPHSDASEMDMVSSMVRQKERCSVVLVVHIRLVEPRSSSVPSSVPAHVQVECSAIVGVQSTCMVVCFAAVHASACHVR